MMHNCLIEEIFPIIQSKCPLVQLMAISPHPITLSETDLHLSIASFKAIVDSFIQKFWKDI